MRDIITDALLKARVYIEAGEQTCICYALGQCVRERKISPNTREHARRYIERQLGGSLTLDTWLSVHRRELYVDLVKAKNYRNRMRKIRLDWINHMVEVLNA